MAGLFISYKRSEAADFVGRLKETLQGHETWLDTEQIEGGDRWEDRLNEAIDNCDIFLAVLTPGYNEHGGPTAKELSRGDARKKRLIPVLLHPDAKNLDNLPFALSGIHWIDFTDRAAWDTSFRALLELIARKPAPGKESKWEAIYARTAKQAQRFVRDHGDTAKGPGTFSDQLYVRRTEERELVRFLAAEDPALLLIGDSGVGKTNLACRWTLDLVEQGHAVLAYDCSVLAGAEIDRELARDLAIRTEELLDALDNIDAEAGLARKKFVLIFESVGDIGGKHSVRDLVTNIDRLIRAVGRQVRVVMTCNAAAWNRLQRQGHIRHLERRFFRNADAEPFMRLGIFTPEEFDVAYTRYQEVFTLLSPLDELTPAVRERLREPVLLRIAAEAFRNGDQPLLPANLGVVVYRRFFNDRVDDDRDRWFVDQLAAEMLERGTSALALLELAEKDDRLRPELLGENPDSVYFRLLDGGLLQELRGEDPPGTLIKFAHSRIAAYALATCQRRQTKDVGATAAELVVRASDFALAWDVARTLLLLSRDKAAFARLAASSDLEQREVAAEALMELYTEDPAFARELLQSLFDEPSEETRRTALKAAYRIGPQARDFFLRAAVEGQPSTRESVKNTLYLIWRNESPVGRRELADTLYVLARHAPHFTYEFLRTLAGEMTLRHPRRYYAIMEFILDLTITIYINHPEDATVIEETAELLEELAVERLYLGLFNKGVLGKGVEKLVLAGVGRVFGEEVMKFMLFAEDMPVERFFALPQEERDRLARIADLFDPQSDLGAAHGEVAYMLQSGLPIFSGAAAMAVAVHAAHDFAAAEPLVQNLWNEIDGVGRLWLLAGFSVLMNQTPREWIGLLEDLTASYIERHRSSFLDRSTGLTRRLDVVLLPLGLAYGKAGVRMELFHALLEKAVADGDTRMTARLAAALGVVGFYHPDGTFDVLRPLLEKRLDESVEKALVASLATVRTLHFDRVDQFLSGAGAPDELRRRIDAAADVELVRRYIRVVGFYNNAVHFTLHYPRMRKPLSAGALRLLATARNGSQFVNEYTATAMRMLHDSKYKVKTWTLPE